MKRPVRGDLGVSETRENPTFPIGGPADQGSIGVNESGTIAQSGAELTQPRSSAVLALRDLRRDLIKKRPSLPEKAKPFASNLIEQTLNIHNEADLERLRPYMERQRKRLEEALSG